jgi:chitodextrinase
MMNARPLLSLLARLKVAAFCLAGCAVGLLAYAGTTTYTYDVHGRLRVVVSPNGTDQSVTSVTLDNSGNRTAVVVSFVDTTPPNPPTGLTATALAFDRIRLNWTTSLDVGGGPVSYYKVYRGGNHVASPTGPPFDDWPLAASTTYSYRVSAVDASGNESSQTAPANATTLPGADLVAPSVPTNLQGSAVSGTQVNLTWGASTDTGGSGLAGYEVFRDSGSTPIGSPGAANYSDFSVSPATTYLYKVRAYDGAGNRSGFSNQISVTTPDTVPPSAPGIPTFGNINGGSATATWTAASDPPGVATGVAGYRYSLNGGGTWSPDLGNVLTANLTGLALATPYTMLVQARDVAGNWGPSSSGAFTTSSVYTDSLAFVGGTNSSSSNPLITGYQPPNVGGLTPATVSGGKTIWNFVLYTDTYCDEFGCTYEYSTYLSISGFSGDPGAAWLQSISVPGGELTGASAVFSCSSGTCTWFWPTPTDLYTTYTLTIVHY